MIHRVALVIGILLASVAGVLGVIALAFGAIDAYLRPAVMVTVIALPVLAIGFASSLRRSVERVKSLRPFIHQHYQQTEALLAIHSSLRPQIPLPPMGDWAMNPDTLSYIASYILRIRPSLILEFGSGVSTLIAALAADKIRFGSVVSLESEENYANQYRGLIQDYGLEHLVEIHYAPLSSIEIQGKSYSWYDMSPLEYLESFDMIIVDGPPADAGKLARFPALPLLYDRISTDGILLLDDADRAEEQTIADMWMKLLPEMTFSHISHMRGTLIVQRQRESASDVNGLAG